MKLTKTVLNEILDGMRIVISESEKEELLNEFSSPVLADDGNYYEYSYQDISEQLRKRLSY